MTESTTTTSTHKTTTADASPANGCTARLVTLSSTGTSASPHIATRSSDDDAVSPKSRGQRREPVVTLPARYGHGFGVSLPSWHASKANQANSSRTSTSNASSAA
ncbi:hypothetical protein H257_00162 [Aphanomyces astaci]|uniref:Uncharacterized protein n=1 Tax=Aphanomyces astaci TaxID=112090 RepID=W4HBX9_APHAT|nr:hypothetical protein H257_00162 [Aphanomyces astaci]ETV88613.1 hypothetical protein H257_00162 [Aphanomyces astaci]|eukprot:XP_009821013.1 hypothetical protein H257_00162 [Aphanomyces astaci]